MRDQAICILPLRHDKTRTIGSTFILEPSDENSPQHILSLAFTLNHQNNSHESRRLTIVRINCVGDERCDCAGFDSIFSKLVFGRSCHLQQGPRSKSKRC